MNIERLENGTVKIKFSTGKPFILTRATTDSQIESIGEKESLIEEKLLESQREAFKIIKQIIKG